MHHKLKNGDRVRVWPMPGLRVKVGPDRISDAGGKPTLVEARLLSAEGEEVTWSAWWHDLAKGGALSFSDPRHEDDGGPKGSGGVQRAHHQRHPHEWVAEFGKPAMHLDDEEIAHLVHRKPLDQLSEEERAACSDHIAWHLAPRAKDERDAHLAKEAAAKAKAEAVEAPRAAELRGDTRLPQITDAEQWPQPERSPAPVDKQ